MDKEYRIKKWKPSIPSPLDAPCPYCRRIPDFNYMVSDDVWNKIVPQKYRYTVVCLRCFDGLAQKKKIDWIPHFKYLWFSNRKVSVKLIIKDVYFDTKNKKEEWIKK